jgi:serralysin
MATITGDKFDNSLTGTSSDDEITGAAGNDTLAGGGGDDKIWGNNGDDLIYGGDGDDLIKGARGADLMYGEAGADTLNGGEGADTMFGGAGADVFAFKMADVDGTFDDILDFAHNVDKIDLSALDGVRIVALLTGHAGELALWSNAGIGLSMLYYDADGDALADQTIRVVGVVSAADIIV